MGIASSNTKKVNEEELIVTNLQPDVSTENDQGFVVVTAASEEAPLKDSMLEAARRGAAVPVPIASEHVKRKRMERMERHRAALAEARSAAAAEAEAAATDNGDNGDAFLSEDDAKSRLQDRRWRSEKERLGTISRALEHNAPSTVGTLQDLSQPAEDSNTSGGYNKRQLRAWRLRTERAAAKAAAEAKEQRLTQFRQAKRAKANMESAAACSAYNDYRHHPTAQKHLRRGGAVTFKAPVDISLHGRPTSFEGQGMVALGVC